MPLRAKLKGAPLPVRLATTLALTLALAGCNRPSSVAGANAEGANSTSNAMAPGNAATSTGTAASASADSFVKEAAAANEYEIAAANLALQRSRDARVKALARMIRADHEKAGRQLVQAVRGGPAPPPAGLDDRRQQLLDELKAAPPADFNSAYLDQQKTAHDSAIQTFSDYAANGDNPDLKRFAAGALPVLRKHDDAVAKLAGELGSGPTASTSGTSSSPGR